MVPRRLLSVCITVLLLAASLSAAACGSAAPGPTTSSSASASASQTSGSNPVAPPNGSAPGGQPGGAGGSTQQFTPTGKYSQQGGTATEANATYSASAADQSAVLVSAGGSLTLADVTIQTSGDSKSLDESSFYGLNAGVLAESGAKIVVSGGSVATSGTGANGVFAYGSGSSITMFDATIKATAQGGHGAMASGGGSMTLKDVDIDTAGANSAPIATDRGGGTITVSGGTILSSGADSPGIYSTGSITVTGARVTATGSEAVVIEGSNSVSLSDTTLSGTKKRGVMIYQSMSGDAQGAKGIFTMTGGSLAVAAGPLFYVTNSTGIITVRGVALTAASGTLIAAGAGDCGTGGSNGGTVRFTAGAEKLKGDVLSDSISSISLTLKHGTTLRGKIDKAGLTLDASSKWIVTADSTLTSLTDASGISGSSITNIVGNGHNVSYDSSLAANSSLGGKTYALVNGGQLIPK